MPDVTKEWPQVCNLWWTKVIRCCIQNTSWVIEIVDWISWEISQRVIVALWCSARQEDWTCRKTQRPCPAKSIPQHTGNFRY